MSSNQIRSAILVLLVVAGVLYYPEFFPPSHPCPVPYSNQIQFIGRDSLKPNITGEAYAALTRPGDRKLRIGFAGDLMQHREQMQDDFGQVYAGIQPLLKQMDLAVGNLEFPVSLLDPIGPPRCSARFNGSVEHLKAITGAGFSVLGTANNHAFDMGLRGIQSTLKAIHETGSVAVGTAPNPGSQSDLTVINVKGVPIGILAYTFILNDYIGDDGEIIQKPADLPVSLLDIHNWEGSVREQGLIRLRQGVESARAKGARYIIGFIHWGEEWNFNASSHQQMAAHDMIDNGFDMVIGSHPHVLQPLEEYKGKLIAYSLGTLSSAFNDVETRTAAILEITLNTESSHVTLGGIAAYPTLCDRQTHQVLLAAQGRSADDESALSIQRSVFGELLQEVR